MSRLEVCQSVMVTPNLLLTLGLAAGLAAVVSTAYLQPLNFWGLQKGLRQPQQATIAKRL